MDTDPTPRGTEERAQGPAAARCADLALRVRQARQLLERCTLCPRRCGVNRLAGELGACRAGDRARVASFGPHFGEEAPLVGRRGSGTIFFAHCNLHCLFCRNFDISQKGEGSDVTAGQLADAMLQLQEYGCHNINLVTPTHYMPQVLEALELALLRGLDLPLVWNCGGYESLEALRLLDGVVDIYMPDAKYASAEVAAELSGVPGEGDAAYPAASRTALREMHRQVGDLVLDERGIALRGLLVRHLVLPEGLAGTAEVMRFLAEMSPETYVNVMDQYRPCDRAWAHPLLARGITASEYASALEAARRCGLHRFAG